MQKKKIGFFWTNKVEDPLKLVMWLDFYVTGILVCVTLIL